MDRTTGTDTTTRSFGFLSLTAGAGFVVTSTTTTGNIGVGRARATSTRYYLSSDASIGAGDVLLGGRSLAALAPGASSASATNVTIPAGTANGSYFIVARADDLNQAFEKYHVAGASDVNPDITKTLPARHSSPPPSP